jgi:hypothetical protein
MNAADVVLCAALTWCGAVVRILWIQEDDSELLDLLLIVT